VHKDFMAIGLNSERLFAVRLTLWKQTLAIGCQKVSEIKTISRVTRKSRKQAGAATGCCHKPQSSYIIFNSSFIDGKIVSGNNIFLYK
jgi:hypothetical protein